MSSTWAGSRELGGEIVCQGTPDELKKVRVP
jgi:hypothetical protein